MTIAEVAAKYGMTADTLRYYERVGLIPPVPRTSGGIRSYGESECSWIEFIKCMRNAGLSIDALVEYVRLYRAGEGTEQARLDLLIEQREIMRRRAAEIQACLDRLDYKINGYYTVILPSEKKIGAGQERDKG